MLTCLFACTASKTLEPSPALQLRRYTHLKPQVAAEAWTAQVAQAETRVPVGRLYKGGYWSMAKDAVSNSELALEAYVASAGLGIRAFDDRVPAYSATFNPGHPDTVPGNGGIGDGRAWWRLLGAPARLRDISLAPGSRLLVALPNNYLQVLLTDLKAVAPMLAPGHLTVFTTSKEAVKSLDSAAVLLEGRMSRVLGGAVGSLTAAALAYCIASAKSETDMDTSSIVAQMADVLRQSPTQTYPKRAKRTEAEVRHWLSEALSSPSPPGSASAALRRFRNAGFAFEQKRFGRLFREISSDRGVR